MAEKGTTLEHLRSLAEASKAFTGGLFSTLAENVVDAILEERGTSVPLTISTVGWQKNNATMYENYPYCYTYSLSGVTEQDRVDIVIAVPSIKSATDCGLCPTCETGMGTITFRAERTPTESIHGEYRVFKGKENH